MSQFHDDRIVANTDKKSLLQNTLENLVSLNDEEFRTIDPKTSRQDFKSKRDIECLLNCEKENEDLRSRLQEASSELQQLKSVNQGLKRKYYAKNTESESNFSAGIL